VQQNVLERAPQADLKVYAIWTDKLFTDSRRKWDAGGLTDPRVAHFWDGPDQLGGWFVKRMKDFQGGDWDTFLLFGPDAKWDAVPSPLLGSGSSVIGQSDNLKKEISPLLGKLQPPA
jgi:hypothetical protein